VLVFVEGARLVNSEEDPHGKNENEKRSQQIERHKMLRAPFNLP